MSDLYYPGSDDRRKIPPTPAELLRKAARELRKQADGGFNPQLAHALDSHALSHDTNDCNFSRPCEMLALARAIAGTL